MAIKLILTVGLVFLAAGTAAERLEEEESSMADEQGEKSKDVPAEKRVQDARGSSGWTRWFDRDDPLPTADYEALCELRIENPGKICDRPSGIQARVKGKNTPASETREYFVKFSPHEGLVCMDAHQLDRRCEDYEVRFWCP
ncbi:cartilage intermediate layer protein 2-like isoform X1 [Branchiostoma floridae x Branchiostoma japonicum]